MGSGDLPEQEPLKVTPGWAMRRACSPDGGLVKMPSYELPGDTVQLVPIRSDSELRAAIPQLAESLIRRAVRNKTAADDRPEVAAKPRALAGSHPPAPGLRPAVTAAPASPRSTPLPAVERRTPVPPWEVVRTVVPESVELQRAGTLAEGERFWVFTTRTPPPAGVRPTVDPKRTPPPAGAAADAAVIGGLGVLQPRLQYSAPVAEPAPRRARKRRGPAQPIPQEMVDAWSVALEPSYDPARRGLIALAVLACLVAVSVGVGLVLSPLETQQPTARLGTVTVESPDAAPAPPKQPAEAQRAPAPPVEAALPKVSPAEPTAMRVDPLEDAAVTQVD